MATIAGFTLPAVANAASVTLVNADFESGSDWESTTPTSPDGWYSSAADAGIDGHYGQTYVEGSVSRHASFKSTGGNYYQQSFSMSDDGAVDAGSYSSYSVALNYGYRQHHTSDGDINIRVSIWNLTDDVEIAGDDILVEDPNPGDLAGLPDTNFLTNAVLALAFDNAGMTGKAIALRIANTSEISDGGSWRKTAFFDDVLLESIGAYTPPPAIGDLDANGLINLADYDIFRGVFGTEATGGADFSGNGFVGHEDFFIFRTEYEANNPGAAALGAIPEPTALAILGLGGLAMLKRSRK